jgi:hypothetical protein
LGAAELPTHEIAGAMTRSITETHSAPAAFWDQTLANIAKKQPNPPNEGSAADHLC